MHLLSPLRHAPDLSKAGAGVAFQLSLSGRATFVGAHSRILSSKSGVRAKFCFGRTIGKQQLRAVHGGDHEVIAMAPVDKGNAWEIDLADDDVRVLAKFKSLYVSKLRETMIRVEVSLGRIRNCRRALDRLLRLGFR